MTAITMGNYKGGVGKTTATQLFAYILSEKHGKKVLAVDTDPQSNLTETLALTFSVDLDIEKIYIMLALLILTHRKTFKH